MKIKFNLYERVAGIFVLTAILGSLALMVGVAVQKGWFERKVSYETKLKSADGVRIGTQVQIAGLRAGQVTDIDLETDNEIRIKFHISNRFARYLRGDSFIRVVRPFIIGEKVLEVKVGSDKEPVLAENELVPSIATIDLMDLLNGSTLGPHLEALGKMMENLKFVAEAILDPQRSRAIIQMFDELRPMVHHLGNLSREASSMVQDLNKKKQLVRVVDNLVALTDEVNKALPTISRDAPGLASDLSKIAHSTAILTEELQKALPAMQEIGPELPRVSRRAIEALDEAVVTLKALQKSFVLRGAVEDVRAEEAISALPRSSKSDRKPSSRDEK
jgi:phospholipid/cholesterol/gamma-HCH transport system substrate-binding protein